MDPIVDFENIAYTFHFYAATHKDLLGAKAQTAIDNGIALVVTEWGTVAATGDGEVDHVSTDEWIQFMAAYDLTHLNWSIHDKKEGASLVLPGAGVKGDWTDGQLTPSGLKVKGIVSNWKQYCK